MLISANDRLAAKDAKYQPMAPGALPSSVIEPFLDAQLENILAPLDAPGLKDPKALTELRASISAGKRHASKKEQAAFQAAIKMCDLLSKALDERHHAVAKLQASQVNSGRSAKNMASSASATITQWSEYSDQLLQQIAQTYAQEIDGEILVGEESPLPVGSQVGPVSGGVGQGGRVNQSGQVGQVGQVGQIQNQTGPITSEETPDVNY
jgi:hypothetical protein